MSGPPDTGINASELDAGAFAPALLGFGVTIARVAWFGDTNARTPAPRACGTVTSTCDAPLTGSKAITSELLPAAPGYAT